jgi:PAS domain S-box-containing protein
MSRGFRLLMHHGMAVVAVALALVLTWLLQPLIAPLVVPLFFAAVLVSARFAGRDPGLVAVLLSAVTMDYFLVSPAFALKANDPKEYFRLGLFALVSVLIIGLTELLRKSEERYRSIVETSSDGVWIIDPAGRIRYANRRLASLVGDTVEGLVGRAWFDLVPDEELPAAQHLAEWKQGVSACLEFRLRRRDRSKLWVQNRVDPMFDERGQFVGAVGTVTDISERRYAQAERQANEERFRMAFNQASVGMSHATLKDGRILTVNERFAQITGYGARELTGMTELDLTHPGDREAEGGLFRRLVAGNIPCYSHEKRYVRKDGAVIPVRLTMSLVRDAEGRPWHTVGVIEEITDRPRATRSRGSAAERGEGADGE